jgi:diguanylate cyclase (GGDEF)-like protein
MEELKITLAVLNKIYDSVRIIRPTRKKILDTIDGELCGTQYNCYDFWTRGKICNNCVSMRAYNKNNISFKLDSVDDKIYMVIAVPVQEASEIVILELLKDVTSSVPLETPFDSRNNTLLQTLYDIGQLQIRDSLTGIFNRRFIDERLPVDILNNGINLIPFTVIFADIDHFKLVNDTFGHVAGDTVLKAFAELIQISLKENEDWVARYGGEEFLIYMRNSITTSAVEFTEKIRKAVENSVFNYKGNNIRITSSFGVCSIRNNWNIKVEELINLVDKNLYAAKSGGRNKIIATEL